MWIKHSQSTLPWAVAVTSSALPSCVLPVQLWKPLARSLSFQVIDKLQDNLVTQGVTHQAGVSRLGKKNVPPAIALHLPAATLSRFAPPTPIPLPPP